MTIRLEALGALMPHTVALAVEHEETIAHGNKLGLSDEQTREVIRAWSDHHRSRLDPLNWGRVREALTARAFGLRWKP